MVTIGSSHVVLSLALVGLELYTLIPGSSTDVPSLQVSFSTRIQLWNFRNLCSSQHFFCPVYPRHPEHRMSMVRAVCERTYLRNKHQ